MKLFVFLFLFSFLFVSNCFVYADTSNSNSGIMIIFPNPLVCNDVACVFLNIMEIMRGIVVIISIIFIVIGGIKYILSAGNIEIIKSAKKTITSSITGLAISLAAPSFLKEIYLILGGKEDIMGDSLSISQIALNLLNFLLSIVGVIALIMIIFGGIVYITSAGNEERVRLGKKITTYSIIGVTIALSSFVIVKQIANLLK